MVPLLLINSLQAQILFCNMASPRSYTTLWGELSPHLEGNPSKEKQKACRKQLSAPCWYSTETDWSTQRAEGWGLAILLALGLHFRNFVKFSRRIWASGYDLLRTEQWAWIGSFWGGGWEEAGEGGAITPHQHGVMEIQIWAFWVCLRMDSHPHSQQAIKGMYLSYCLHWSGSFFLWQLHCNAASDVSALF